MRKFYADTMLDKGLKHSQILAAAGRLEPVLLGNQATKQNALKVFIGTNCKKKIRHGLCLPGFTVSICWCIQTEKIS